MKQPILFCVLLTFTVNGYSYNYKPGDQMYVVALQGVNLRETPAASGKLLTKLACGDTVVVVDHFQLPADSIDGFNGNWVKVRTLAKTEGYVFDAFISHYPVLGKERLLLTVGSREWRTLRDGLLTLYGNYVHLVFRPTGCNFTYHNGEPDEGEHSMTVRELEGRNQQIWHSYPWHDREQYELELHNPRPSEMYYLVLNVLKYLPDSLYHVQKQNLHRNLVFGQEENSICLVDDTKGNCVVRIVYKRNVEEEMNTYVKASIVVEYATGGLD